MLDKKKQVTFEALMITSRVQSPISRSKQEYSDSYLKRIKKDEQQSHAGKDTNQTKTHFKIKKKGKSRKKANTDGNDQHMEKGLFIG